MILRNERGHARMPTTNRPRANKIKDRFKGLCACGDHAWATMTKGYVVLVSPQDAALISDHCWYPLKPQRTVYATRSGGGHFLYLHREILQPEIGRVVDHLKGNGLDNRRPMIEDKSHLKNCHSFRRPSRRNSSGHPSVFYKKETKTWTAAIGVLGKQVWLGSFKTKEAAIAAAEEGRKKYHG